MQNPMKKPNKNKAAFAAEKINFLKPYYKGKAKHSFYGVFGLAFSDILMYSPKAQSKRHLSGRRSILRPIFSAQRNRRFLSAASTPHRSGKEVHR